MRPIHFRPDYRLLCLTYLLRLRSRGGKGIRQCALLPSQFKRLNLGSFDDVELRSPPVCI